MVRPAAIAGLTALLLAAPARAQDRAAAVDRVFSFATPATPGCAVGVSQRGQVLVNRAYGLADVERRTPLGPRTAFDIGSTQKQFVAAAVLLLVEDGRLALSDDVRRYLPELPDYGRTVTIDHLLTHTGGVRDWTGLLPMAEEGADVLPLILRQRGLNFAPGTEWSYSSSGYVLLREVVARASGRPFADFARTRIFEPLGMRSSAYVEDILKADGERALGYRKEGAGWTPFMYVGSRRGGGTIASTVGDLLLWNDALASGKLGRFVTTKLQEPARLANGRRLSYARGLTVDSTPGGTVVSHSGGAAGFSTWLGRVPAHGLSVAVACNFDPVSATALARRVAGVYVPGMASQAHAPGPVAAPGVDVSGRAGLYFEERTGEPLRLIADAGRLAIANGPALVPVSADRFRPRRATLFFRSEDAFELTFRSNDAFELTSMEGQTTRFRRARPWTPGPADLQAVAGRYESRDLGTVMEVLPGAGGGLVLRSERTPARAVELAPVERDTYMQRMMIVRVRRDAGGAVAGVEYGNPIVRKLELTRLGDRATADRATALGAAPGPAVQPATGAATASVAAPAPRPEGLTGAYELAPGRSVTVTLDGGRLYGQPSGGKRRALTHVTGATFAAEGSPLTLTFTLGADGRATAMVMRQNGRERTLPKVP